ncbi:MAG: HDOD domain-containing protein [Betaproteobacteria bacterium]|nr:HDOD domain-containing protein [Betaproteobacteria bacterium]
MKIGRFEVSRVLGHGMQSIVYLATDPMLEREVAIKALPNTAAADARQLLAEARIAGRLRHPHIVPAFDVGEHEGHPYLVFEFVDGDTLAGFLKKTGAVSPQRAVAMMARILDAIGYAHEQGVVHRDLKPANIIVDEDDFPRVMDFGVALRVSSQAAPDMTLVGTPAYMAPEYVKTGTSTAGNDLFACGLLLAEMLTGRRVIVAANAIEAINALLNDPIEMPDAPQPIDERLAAVVRKAIAREPADRFASAAQMKSALEGCLADASTPDADSAGKGRVGNSTLEFLLRRMRHRTDFPALSGAISAVNKALASESESIATLANTILQDFALTNKILRLVNSAGFGGSSGRISTISRAVQILGFDQVRNIAVSLMLFEHLQNKAQASALRDEFMKTLFSGVLARAAAPKAALRDPEEAFVCALFHNLGRLLCLFYFPEEWAEIQRLVTEERNDEAVAARRVLGASFEQLGTGTAEAWGFPKKICYSMKSLPPGSVRKATSQDDGLRLVSTFASEVSAAAGGDDGERAAAFARIGSRYKGALPFDGDQIGTLVTDSLSSLSTYASALNLNVSQSGFGRVLLRLGVPVKPARKADAGAAAGTAASADPGDGSAAASMDTGDLGVLRDPSEETIAPCASAPVDAQAELSSGIQDLSNALVEGMPMNEVLRIVLETMYRAIGFRRVLLCVRDVKANTMSGRFGFGQDASAVARRFSFSMQFKPDVFFAALTKNADILITDVDDPKIASRVPEWYRTSVGARTFIVFPLVVNEKPFGLIYADAELPGQIEISPNVLKLLRTLRNQAVLAIKQAR